MLFESKSSRVEVREWLVRRVVRWMRRAETLDSFLQSP